MPDRLLNKTREVNELRAKFAESSRIRNARIHQLQKRISELPLEIESATSEVFYSDSQIRDSDQEFVKRKFSSFEKKKAFIALLRIRLKTDKAGSKRDDQNRSDHIGFIQDACVLCDEYISWELVRSNPSREILIKYLFSEDGVTVTGRETKIVKDWVDYSLEPPSDKKKLKEKFDYLQKLIDKQFAALISFEETRNKLLADLQAKETSRNALKEKLAAFRSEMNQLCVQENFETAELAKAEEELQALLKLLEIEKAIKLLLTPFTRERNFAEVLAAHRLLREEGTQAGPAMSFYQTLRNDFLDVLCATHDKGLNPNYIDFYATTWEMKFAIELPSHLKSYSYQVDEGQVKNYFAMTYAKLICSYAKVPFTTMEDFARATNLANLSNLDEKLHNLRTYANGLPENYKSAVHRLVDDLQVMMDIFKLAYTKCPDLDKETLITQFKEGFKSRIERDLPLMNSHRDLGWKIANLLLFVGSILTLGLIAGIRNVCSKSSFWFETNRGRQLHAINDEALTIKVR